MHGIRSLPTSPSTGMYFRAQRTGKCIIITLSLVFSINDPWNW
jgi:hypothetical protein